MKLGTFVMGGLAGAVVVMMIQRNRMMSTVASGVGSNLKRSMNNMKDDAIEKALNMKFASSFKRATDSVRHSANASASSESRGGDLDDVRNLAAQDPHVNKEINSILEENREHRL